jgi:hypothetical protein
MFFDENIVDIQVPKKNFDELDAEVIDKLQKNKINVDEVVKNLEKLYKGIFKFFL